MLSLEFILVDMFATLWSPMVEATPTPESSNQKAPWQELRRRKDRVQLESKDLLGIEKRLSQKWFCLELRPFFMMYKYDFE